MKVEHKHIMKTKLVMCFHNNDFLKHLFFKEQGVLGWHNHSGVNDTVDIDISTVVKVLIFFHDLSFIHTLKGANISLHGNRVNVS